MPRQKNTLRRVVITGGIFLITLPFLIALASNSFGDGDTGVFLLLSFLTFWAIIVGLVSQSRKVFFWCAVAIVWFLGLMVAFMANSPAWLMIPLGLCIVLGAVYTSIVGQHGTPAPHEATRTQQSGGTVVNNYISVYTHPQGATHTYQQGYQASQPSQPIQPTGPMYSEGEKLYSYPHVLYEQPQVQYPPEKQQ